MMTREEAVLEWLRQHFDDVTEADASDLLAFVDRRSKAPKKKPVTSPKRRDYMREYMRARRENKAAV